MTKIFIWPLIATIFFSCAKKPEYDTVFKVAEQTSRSKDYDTDSVYVYLPSTLDAPRNVTVKAPYWQDNEILVKLKWTKEGLSVYSPDKDLRFDFSRNQKPVFTIPGRYRAYQCAKNNLGECTNREEEDIETPWEKRPYFDPNLEQISFSRSLTSMDIFHDDGCIIQKNTRLKDYLIKRGIINIELEREFRISSSDACLNKYLKYEAQRLNTQDFSFKTTFFYSLVRLKDLASPDYKKFNYPLLDQDKFGYFLNLRKTLDENFRRVKKTYLLNRWNPGKKYLTYHLSEGFNKPGQELIKEETYKAVEDINKILGKAEVPFKIKLEEPSGKKSGDLRYNMVVLITDPLRNGLLGYAPTVSNPITGEIIQGHINMYSGVLTSMVPSVYENMIRLSHHNLSLRYLGGEGKTVSSISESGESAENRSLRLSQRSMLLRVRPKFAKPENPSLKLNPDYWSKNSPLAPPTNLSKKNTFLENINFFAKNNAYHKDLYLSGGGYKNYIPGIKEIKNLWADNGTLLKWSDLSKAQKKKVTKLILPHIYRTTFIHEFGHSLGLRHNFMGSIDSKHFYSEEDANTYFDFSKNKSMDGENFKPPQFSSIMDYGYSELNQLPIFGKYDLAALRYGYARKIELEAEEGKKLVKLSKKGINPLHIPKLVKYEFCTDENVNTNPMCNRFDEGVTYTDIMNHYQAKYEGDFFITNFRNDKTTFDRYRNIGYFWWRYSQFKMIRRIFESYESYIDSFLSRRNIKNTISARKVISQEVEKCRNKKTGFCERVLDLHEASTLAGKFFLDILKTPEHSCLFNVKGKVDDFNLRSLHGFFDLVKAPTSCFDKEVLKSVKKKFGWTLLGERGRYLTDLNENDPEFKYASDISARGIWLDKALAMQFLFGRNLPSTKVDDPELGFREHPVIGPLMDEFNLDYFDQTKMKNVPKYSDEFGKALIDLEQKFEGVRYNEVNNPEIPSQVSATLNYFLALPWRSSFRLNRVLINAAENYLQTTSPKIRKQAKIDRDFYLVKKFGDHLSFNQGVYRLSYLMGDGFIYAASKSNVLASNLITPINYFKMVETDSKVISFLTAEAAKDNPMDLLTLMVKIKGRKNNPYVNFTERENSLEFPIVKKLQSYFVDFPKNLQAFGIHGGLALKKVYDMALKRPELTEEDFIIAFGQEDGKVLFKSYSPSEMADYERAYKKVGGEIDCINMSIPDLDRAILMAKAIEGGSSIDNVLKSDDPYFEKLKFILTEMKSGEILKIRNWLEETTKMPKDFPLDHLYSIEITELNYIIETLKNKDLEELEYTLKFLPSY